MALLGKTINLYLMDGTASGRWQATLSNWNGTAYKVPRDELKNCSDISEISNPGVYLLFGKDDESGKQFVYVGEADDVLKRLQQPHTFEKDGTYWSETVIFVTPDGTLEKGRVKYLENRLYTIANEAKRYIVKNGNTPPQSPMAKQIRDLLEEFIINIKLVLPALGHKVCEPQPSSDSNEKGSAAEDLLYFSKNHGKGGQATGKLSSDGFWVLKGSYIYPNVAAYTSPGIKRYREQYASAIDSNGILQQDIPFGSPSYAAAFVCGKNINGLTEWKDKNGVSLKEQDAMPSDDAAGKKKSNPKASDALSKKGTNAFHLVGKKLNARGHFSDSGFVVYKGSECSPNEATSCPSWIKGLRSQLFEEGKVKNCVFTEDVCFESVSAAAACLVGYSVNGKTMWADSNGKTIKELHLLRDDR